MADKQKREFLDPATTSILVWLGKTIASAIVSFFVKMGMDKWWDWRMSKKQSDPDSDNSSQMDSNDEK